MSGYISPNLGLKYLSELQSGKATSVNEALGKIDYLCHLSVIAADVTTPPSSPSEGDRYIIPTGATGVWSGKTNQLAGWYGGWVYTTPINGWVAFNQDISNFMQFDGTNWTEFAGAGSLEFDDLTNVTITTPLVNQSVFWDVSTSKWINRKPELEDIRNIDMTAKAEAKVLTWNGTTEKAEWRTPSGGGGGSGPEIKAWCNLDGTTNTIRQHSNISSVTNIATGVFRFNFSTAMSTSNFAYSLNGKFGSDANDGTQVLVSEKRDTGTTRSTTELLVISTFQSSFSAFSVHTICLIVVE